MNKGMARRDFLSAGALGAILPLLPRMALGEVGASLHAPPLLVQPFELRDVRLRPGPVLDALMINQRCLLALDPDQLLHTFRITASLPTTAEPLGGWEAPDNELRGHFTGHYLSACALLWAQTGDVAAKARGELIAAALAQCQAAIGGGYLSAFPEELFDRLREGKQAWAPFYTVHKIMAGLLDSYALCGNAQALDVLKGMARWVALWVRPLSDERMARVLDREFGGMNEVLYNLYATTGEERWREVAKRFDREMVYAALAAGRDELKGMHVNTTIPQIIGAARGYELTGSRHLHDTADYFWRTVTERRCYCTGGTSNEESWNSSPGELAKELSGYTQECCVTYNMQKLTRHVFSWTADPRVADYYERAYYNGILGVQHPADGDKLYYVPLASGYWKLFGTPLQDFWCCTGSMAESFAKLGDSIYFHDANGIYVNLFVASEVNWKDKDLRLVQETNFPDEDTIRLTVRTAKPQRMALRIRVPYWCQAGSAAPNGRALEGFAAPGSYFVLDREWRDGDRVGVTLPMHLHMHAMPDDPTVQAVMIGPLVLAGRLGTAGLTKENLRAEPTKPRTVPEYHGEPVAAPVIHADADDPASWLKATPGRPLEFRSHGQERELSLIPLNRILDERYAVYWKFAQS